MATSYRLVGRIGSGGMAEVYLGKSLGAAGFEKEVAVKVILPAFTAEPQVTAMLIEEARIATRLNHVNVVQVLDLGQSGPRYFIVMEYVDGADLFSILCAARRMAEPLPVELAGFICQQVLQGLTFVHEQVDPDGRPLELVHRDVSPPNILLSRTGSVKLADFGIAKAATSNIVTEAGMVRGKAGYMSPEQASGATLDQRSDLFALGVVLHEMLAGQELYPGQNPVEVYKRMTEEPIRPPSEVNPRIASALDRVVMRALSIDPQDRFQSAREFNRALEQAMQENNLRASAAVLESWLKTIMPERRIEPLPSSDDEFACLTSEDSRPGTRPMELPAAPKASGRYGVWLTVAVLVLAAAVVFALVWEPAPERTPEKPPPPKAPAVEPPVAKAEPAPEEAPQPEKKPPKIRLPVKTGILYLNSEPWARILVDGQDTGVTTPTVEGLRLPAGRHKITLVNPELELKLTTRIVVKAGGQVKKFFDLRRDGVQQ